MRHASALDRSSRSPNVVPALRPDTRCRAPREQRDQPGVVQAPRPAGRPTARPRGWSAATRACSRERKAAQLRRRKRRVVLDVRARPGSSGSDRQDGASARRRARRGSTGTASGRRADRTRRSRRAAPARARRRRGRPPVLGRDAVARARAASARSTSSDRERRATRAPRGTAAGRAHAHASSSATAGSETSRLRGLEDRLPERATRASASTNGNDQPRQHEQRGRQARGPTARAAASDDDPPTASSEHDPVIASSTSPVPVWKFGCSPAEVSDWRPAWRSAKLGAGTQNSWPEPRFSGEHDERDAADRDRGDGDREPPRQRSRYQSQHDELRRDHEHRLEARVHRSDRQHDVARSTPSQRSASLWTAPITSARNERGDSATIGA